MNIIDTNATVGTENAATSMTNINDVGREQQHENTAETTGTNPAVNELDAAFKDSCEQAGKSIALETQSEAARRRALADLAFILVKDRPHLEFVGKLLTQQGLEEKYKARTSAALVRVSFGFKQTKEKTEKAKKEN